MRTVGFYLGIGGFFGNFPCCQLLWYIQHRSFFGNIGSCGITIDLDEFALHYGNKTSSCRAFRPITHSPTSRSIGCRRQCVDAAHFYIKNLDVLYIHLHVIVFGLCFEYDL